VYISIDYRVDQRIRKVEVKSGDNIFIVELDLFCEMSDIRDFSEWHMGTVSIPIANFVRMRKERVTYGKPLSFRFRRAKREGEME
jgi:hypothetical protein